MRPLAVVRRLEMVTVPIVFISHSSADGETAAALVRLLRSALNLTPPDIRCTSVEGYRLPAGAPTDLQLREEIIAAAAMIGLISPGGMSSAYVPFELGARWGAKRYLGKDGPGKTKSTPRDPAG